jgi:hypothetical protein
MALELVGHGDRVWLTHAGGSSTLVVDPGGGGPFDGRELGVDLHWRCAQVLAALTLDRVLEGARRTGDLDLVLRVVRAQLSLPFDEGELAAAHARLN